MSSLIVCRVSRENSVKVFKRQIEYAPSNCKSNHVLRITAWTYFDVWWRTPLWQFVVVSSMVLNCQMCVVLTCNLFCYRVRDVLRSAAVVQ